MICEFCQIHMEHSEQAAAGQHRALWRCTKCAEAIMDHDAEYVPPARYVGPIAELRGREVEVTPSHLGRSVLVSWVDESDAENPVKCIYASPAHVVVEMSPSGARRPRNSAGG